MCVGSTSRFHPQMDPAVYNTYVIEPSPQPCACAPRVPAPQPYSCTHALGSHSDPLAAKVSLFSPPPLPPPKPPLPPLRRRRCRRRRRRRRRRHPHHLHHHLHHCHPHSHHPIPLSRHSGRTHVVRLSASTACTLSLPIAAPSTPFPLSRHTLFSTRMKKASPSSPGQSPPMQRQRRR